MAGLMKTIYITSLATAVLFMLFLSAMSTVRAPLGGQPFAVTSFADREKAEKMLADKIAEQTAAKNKKPQIKKAVSQKEPRYFKQNDGQDNIVILKGEGTSHRHSTELDSINGSFKKLGNNELVGLHKNGLPPAPDVALIEKTEYGVLPRISDDGKRALEVYARPSFISELNDNSIKSIAILVTNLGLSQPITDNALEKLPPEITISMNPYATNLNSWVRRARQSGHELMLQLPMEPYDYPDNDPGPHTLLAGQTDKINIQRLRWIMSRMNGYIGMVNINGSKFSTDENALHPILQEIKIRGLSYMDVQPEAPELPYQLSQELKLEYHQGSLIIDKVQTKEAIDIELKKLEQLANQHGKAIGVASGLPLSIQRISEWAATLKKRGINLVPISATLSKRQS